jgi:hypothetical protein
VASVGLTKVHIRGFRSLKDVWFHPGPMSALVGEAGVGKSNLLAAIRALLDPEAAPLTADDFPRNGDGPIRIQGLLAGGSSIAVEGPRPRRISPRGPDGTPALFLPASLRTGRVVASSRNGSQEARRADEILRRVIPGLALDDGSDSTGGSATEAARGLVAGLESVHRAEIGGLIFLIEEPELFLPPQTQRYLYRLLRFLSGAGNQVIYSTHSPAFLNVGRLDELVFIDRRSDLGTRVLQPEALPSDEEFRASSEFDSVRGELFLARAAVLVEGLTEKLALPFVFEALGYDPDRERISIVECGGKANIPLVARITRTVGIPFVAVHDRDAPEGKQPSLAERQLNDLIAAVAGKDGRVELAPDFEGVAGLRGHRHKPARAWRSFASLEAGDVPEPLGRVVERAVMLARR